MFTAALLHIESQSVHQRARLAVTCIHNRRKEKKRHTTITLTDLQEVYHLPISSTAKKFDMGLTLLKKRCRELGLKRWSYRKLKSMDKLLQSIESVDGQDPQVHLLLAGFQLVYLCQISDTGTESQTVCSLSLSEGWSNKQ